MNEQVAITLALSVVSFCSIAFVLTLPALATTALRGNLAGVIRLGMMLVVLAAVAIAFSAFVGASPVAYLLVA